MDRSMELRHCGLALLEEHGNNACLNDMRPPLENIARGSLNSI
jgi:hypothetical protein